MTICWACKKEKWSGELDEHGFCEACAMKRHVRRARDLALWEKKGRIEYRRAYNRRAVQRYRERKKVVQQCTSI